MDAKDWYYTCLSNVRCYRQNRCK